MFFVLEQLEEFSMDSELESARVKELSVFESIKFYCIYMYFHFTIINFVLMYGFIVFIVYCNFYYVLQL